MNSNKRTTRFQELKIKSHLLGFDKKTPHRTRPDDSLEENPKSKALIIQKREVVLQTKIAKQSKKNPVSGK